MSQILDEQLIDEVAHHGVIFNRQKYYLNGSGTGISNGNTKYETKDEAWQTIAMKLSTDVDTCKKRWKYLRERYVSQRKQCDPPVYEHLSRPYLEKMKFLDQHIQPRKSYRNVPSFLTSPHSANSSNYSEYNMDSKSNSSMKNLNLFATTSQPPYHHASQEQAHAMNALTTAAALDNTTTTNGQVKVEADVFRDFAAAVASHQLQHISQSQMPNHQHQLHHNQVAAVAAAMAADSSQNFQDHFRNGSGPKENSGIGGGGGGSAVTNGSNNGTSGIPSSSSSMKSPLSSPLPTNGQNGTGPLSTSTPQQVAAHSSTSQMANGYNDCTNGDLDSSTPTAFHAKRPRFQLPAANNNMQLNGNNGNASANNSTASNNHFTDDTDDESDDNSSNIIHPQTILHEHSPHNHFDASASTSNPALMHLRNATTSNNATNNNQMNNNHNVSSNNSNHASTQNMFPANADFLFQLYQQLPHQAQAAATNHPHQQHQQQSQQQTNSHHQFTKLQTLAPPSAHTAHAPQRGSEHLLGELVTTELLKMNKDKRKNAQKRILEILFFDD